VVGVAVAGAGGISVAFVIAAAAAAAAAAAEGTAGAGVGAGSGRTVRATGAAVGSPDVQSHPSPLSLAEQATYLVFCANRAGDIVKQTSGAATTAINRSARESGLVMSDIIDGRSGFTE